AATAAAASGATHWQGGDVMAEVRAAAAAAGGEVAGAVGAGEDGGVTTRLRQLYPAVNEDESPLPRAWSAKDKLSYIGLSLGNLRVHYKGHGKTPKDAASVRANYPIPAACGIYYFEVKIVSKGRDGYMGIGLSTQEVNMNRLPGWDKYSYGYHGDDGHSFCSSGAGRPYGPTFSTGDVVGCCVNLVNGTAFYTKNGHSLGTAFTDLPPNLYPTVGLQTPGEVVEANFGGQPFAFDIENHMQEWRARISAAIARFPTPGSHAAWQGTLHTMVASYLVHHGYCGTAEAFAASTGLEQEEDMRSVRNRHRIQALVLAGRMGEAIEATQQSYPGLLDRYPELLFRLKVRQFVEMVNGTDSEVHSLGARSPKSQDGPRVPYGSGHTAASSSSSSNPSSPAGTIRGLGQTLFSVNHSRAQACALRTARSSSSSTASPASTTRSSNSCGRETYKSNPHSKNGLHSDSSERVSNGRQHATNGALESHPPQAGYHFQDPYVEGDDEPPGGPRPWTLCGGAVEHMVHFGRELQAELQRMCSQISREHTWHLNARALQDAFSLLAYADPWRSPVGYLLGPAQREHTCAALNSTILESLSLPRQPALSMVVGQLSECLRLMPRAGLGSAAFAPIHEYTH
uniref:RAN binding protein 10 n=1 Tax=Petromyzon marinus TaxID=7757 RepID=S4RDR9_PETMA